MENKSKTQIYTFEINLSQDPAKVVEEIYSKLQELPIVILQGLESFIEDSPLTRKKRFVIDQF